MRNYRVPFRLQTFRPMLDYSRGRYLAKRTYYGWTVAPMK